MLCPDVSGCAGAFLVTHVSDTGCRLQPIMRFAWVCGAGVRVWVPGLCLLRYDRSVCTSVLPSVACLSRCCGGAYMKAGQLSVAVWLPLLGVLSPHWRQWVLL